MAEAAREDDYEETIEEDRVMEADASSDEDVASNSGRYSTQLSVEASFISMDTSTSSSTMCTSLDDVEVCLSICVFVCLCVFLFASAFVCPFVSIVCLPIYVVCFAPVHYAGQIPNGQSLPQYQPG